MGFVEKKEEECDCRNCRIEIKDSIVVIICGEVEVEKLKHCLGSLMEAKDNK
ncbi:MAG: hypothetical protein A4E52_00635 [Pelotomaculum sp. PtaB.Bin013]|uniref:Uncharacterized protein n=1 Tax=Pelotomaculum isophthalicicum JI TaxID=947010 RepID=A0A9X4H3F2_9FIRM|nr:hypothetical protein [Pelotomaculum isophthalicicum]MDF9406902.1 hypothetical protein [Pelotomaculum isophthalicicum JI]OPX91028.1 MAG: hypothetical protein A4E52_00635 [Pelotomaculum sp. PtaB.Bin013]